ncbi:12067_t:CDS:2, partial [Acaulospora morrowiae]
DSGSTGIAKDGLKFCLGYHIVKVDGSEQSMGLFDQLFGMMDADCYKKQTGLKGDSAKSQTDKSQAQAEEQTKRQKASTAKALYRAIEPIGEKTKNGKKRKRSNKKKTQGQQKLDLDSTQKMERKERDPIKRRRKDNNNLIRIAHKKWKEKKEIQ